LSNQ
jgi:hypothetical protein